MNLFSSFKKKPSLAVVFDIREFSLTTAIIRTIKNQKSELLFCQNFEVIESELATYKQYSASLIKTLDKAIIETKKTIIKMDLKEDLSKYFFFIGSPWVVSKSKSVKIVKDKSFLIDDALLKRILLNKEDLIQKEIQIENSQGQWEIFEEKIVEAKLNGYKVTDFHNRKTKEFESHLFTSFIATEICDKIKSYLGAKFKKEGKECSHSTTLSSFTFTRDLYSDKNNYVYVEIGKLITDIYVVLDDVIHGIASFPFGETAIIESVSRNMKITKEMVNSMLNIKCHGKCDEETDKKIDSFIKMGLSEWSDRFNASFAKICDEKDAPTDIIMTTNTDISKLFINNIKSHNETSLKIYNKDTNLTIISEGILNNFVIGGKIFRNQPFIKMDIILLDKLTNQKNICLKK